MKYEVVRNEVAKGSFSQRIINSTTNLQKPLNIGNIKPI